MMHFLTETLLLWYISIVMGVWVLVLVSVMAEMGCEAYNIKCELVNKSANWMFDNPRRSFWFIVSAAVAALIAIVKAI